MTIVELVLILVRGLGQGAIFALIAMSLNVIASASSILNFAVGALMVLAGVGAYMILPSDPTLFGWIMAGLLIALGMGVFGFLQGGLTLIPLKSSVEQHSWLITTMAVSIIIGAGIHLFGGSLAFRVPSPIPPVTIYSTTTPTAYLLLIVLAVAVYLCLKWFHSRTYIGLAMSAVAQDLDASKAAGINVRRVQLASFSLAGVVLGLTGHIGAPVINISADTGIGYLLSGFTAAVVGGMGNNLGALVGGAMVGVLSMFAAYQFGGIYQDSVTMGLLILVLMIRPEGIFGLAAARKV
ncbi:MAG: branched-chain amino acid ABC transporter permease [Pseudomonadota bacterium]|nr:branched-chain amino acid ABC transporter permease [Pseudomonadota bacterium]